LTNFHSCAIIRVQKGKELINMKQHNGILTAGELREMIAEVADDEPILFMREHRGAGYDIPIIQFCPAEEGEDEESSLPATLWLID
jgi:hypothetical protein